MYKSYYKYAYIHSFVLFYFIPGGYQGSVRDFIPKTALIRATPAASDRWLRDRSEPGYCALSGH